MRNTTLAPAAEARLDLFWQWELDRRIKVTLAWNIVGLEAKTIGIFKEDGVVTRRPIVFLWGVDDARASLQQKLVDLIHVLTRPRAKTQVVQTGPIGVELGACMLGTRSPNADTRPTSNAIEEGVRLDQALHLEERQQLLIEREAASVISHRKVHMRDSVQLHCRTNDEYDPNTSAGINSSPPNILPGMGIDGCINT